MVDCKECENYNICEIRKMVEGKLNRCHSFVQKEPQTNADRINAMTPEQKAEFLSTFSVEQIVGEWCTKLCPRRKAGEEECDCQYSIKDSIEGWLKAEAKEEV